MCVCVISELGLSDFVYVSAASKKLAGAGDRMPEHRIVAGATRAEEQSKHEFGLVFHVFR